MGSASASRASIGLEFDSGESGDTVSPSSLRSAMCTSPFASTGKRESPASTRRAPGSRSVGRPAIETFGDMLVNVASSAPRCTSAPTDVSHVDTVALAAGIQTTDSRDTTVDFSVIPMRPKTDLAASRVFLPITPSVSSEKPSRFSSSWNARTSSPRASRGRSRHSGVAVASASFGSPSTDSGVSPELTTAPCIQEKEVTLPETGAKRRAGAARVTDNSTVRASSK